VAEFFGRDLGWVAGDAGIVDLKDVRDLVAAGG